MLVLYNNQIVIHCYCVNERDCHVQKIKTFTTYFKCELQVRMDRDD